MVVLLGLSACVGLQTSSEYLLRGDGYFKDGNLKKSLAAYDRAIALNPNNLEAYASRGSAHYFAGNYDLAQQDFEHVLMKNSYQADAYGAYGSVLAARGDFEMALKVLDVAIKFQPEKPENYFSRAGVYFMLGRYQEALADYSKVLELYPAADVYNARGVVYQRMGQPAMAKQDFDLANDDHIPATLSVYSMIK